MSCMGVPKNSYTCKYIYISLRPPYRSFKELLGAHSGLRRALWSTSGSLGASKVDLKKAIRTTPGSPALGAARALGTLAPRGSSWGVPGSSRCPKTC